MHYHHTYELYYLLNGEREYFIGDKFYRVFDGDLVLIPRNTIHRTAGKDAARYLLYFSSNFLSEYFKDELISKLPLNRPLVLRPDDDIRKHIERMLKQMYSIYKDDSQDNEAILASALCSLLFDVFRSQNQYVSSECSDARFEAIIQYINNNYAKIDNIEDVARKFFISKYHLCRMFNKNLNVSFISHLNAIKVRAAVELLHQSKLSLTEIATRCGFNSSSYFCKVFKGEKGVSPSAYRQNPYK